MNDVHLVKPELSQVPPPGPAFHFPDAWSKLKGTSYKDIKLLHDQYGPVVRITPDALSYNTVQAWKGNPSCTPSRASIELKGQYYRYLYSEI